MYVRLQQKGFHLLELLMVLVLVSIMSQWITMSYQHLIAKARRHVAVTALYQLSSALENYAMVNLSYEHATLTNLHLPEFVAEHHYQLILEKSDKLFFQIAAQPLAAQAQHDVGCGKLILNSRGEKFISGTRNVRDCW